MGVVRNVYDDSGCGTLKLTVSEELIDGKTDFLHAITNSGKPQVTSMIFGCEWSKMAM